jgi:hypothetical protein
MFTPSSSIQPTRTRPTTRYQDENVIQTGLKSTSIAGKPQQQQPVKSVLGVNNNHNIQVDEKKATAVGVKRPALASKVSDRTKVGRERDVVCCGCWVIFYAFI